jgi:hypothetical protein
VLGLERVDVTPKPGVVYPKVSHRLKQVLGLERVDVTPKPGVVYPKVSHCLEGVRTIRKS